MKRKLIIIGLVIIIFGSIAYKLAANKKIINEKKQVENNEIVIPVTTITTAYKDINRPFIKQGTLIPYKEADITSVSAGKLTSVNFVLGDFVKKGTTLATVDNTTLKLNLKAAKLNKNKAETDYKRSKALLAGDATTTIKFKDTKFNYENAKNKIAQIKQQISDNQIKAPVSGQIVSKNKEAGEYVNPGMVLGHIVEVDKLKADIMVSEQEVYKLKKNQAVEVTTAIYPGVSFTGKIIFISQKGDDVHNYQVEIALHNKKAHPLKAGSFADVNFEQESHEKQLLIPKSALIESLDHPKVYVVKEGKATVQKITTGDAYGNDITVVNGLQAGEQIITSGLVNISEGTPVQPVKQ